MNPLVAAAEPRGAGAAFLENPTMNRQTPWHHPKRCSSAILVCALMAQMAVPAHAFVSQLPGVYTTPPDVNVMFTLDDSGSMYSEAIPDYPQNVPGMLGDDASGALGGLGATNNFGTQFPALWYEGRNRRGVVVSRSGYFDVEYYKMTNSVARFLRSSAGNPLYYDPNVTYQPWPTAADDSVLHPDANPSAVNIHPADPFNTARAIDIVLRRGAVGADDENANFWPATYFKYKGPAPLTIAEIGETGNNIATNFDKIEIKSAVLTPTFARKTKTLTDGSVVPDDERTDCGAGTLTCPYAAEIQNFANWLQYYHSRLLMAKGGVAAAFARQGTNLRVGFGTINSSPVVRRGVAQFSGANRTAFYNEMYPRVNAGGTPLREAMDKVGIYFKRADVGNPWAEDPTSSAIGTEHACRRSFHILSTDGFWNGNAANSDIANNNIDDFTGKKTPPRPLATLGEDFSNAAGSKFGIAPFADTTTNTLSDVAAYYWREDLRALPNEVVPTNQDPAFWQHLTTYTIGLGITGSGKVARTSDGSTTVPAGLPSTDPLFKYRGKAWLEEPFLRDWLVTNKVPMTWPAAVANAAETGDDLVHAAMVGRGKYFSATNPKDLANGLAATLAEAANQPLDYASLAVDSAQVISGGKAYQATFSPSGWYGRLYAFKQGADGIFSNTPSTLTALNPDQAWEASNMMPKPTRQMVAWAAASCSCGTT
jgi:type IV pilus assembly protein PilY1